VNRTLWSGMTWQYWLATRRFDPSEYHFLGFADSDRDTRLTQHVALTPVVGHQG